MAGKKSKGSSKTKKSSKTASTKKFAAFHKDVAALAVTHGLAKTTAAMNCWELRKVNGKLVWVYIC